MPVMRATLAALDPLSEAIALAELKMEKLMTRRLRLTDLEMMRGPDKSNECCVFVACEKCNSFACPSSQNVALIVANR